MWSLLQIIIADFYLWVYYLFNVFRGPLDCEIIRTVFSLHTLQEDMCIRFSEPKSNCFLNGINKAQCTYLNLSFK